MNITVEDLTVDLGSERVLESVSATVADGEFVGLVGPNGAGKTTLLRSVLGTIQPTSGHAILGDDPVSGLSSREASRRVAAVPQRTGVSFEFTVKEIVEMGRYPHHPRFGSDPDPELVRDAMERTSVTEFTDRSIDAISGGERQRVLLARALAQDTPALLLDEPTASLDVNHQVRTLNLVAELAEEGHSILAAIHDLNLAARYCDRLLLLAGGVIVARGTPERVLTTDTLEAAFDTRAVVRDDPVTASPVVTALPPRSIDRDATVHVLGSSDLAAEAISRLDDAGFSVTAGVVPPGDIVTEVGSARDIHVVQSPPFDRLDTERIHRVSELCTSADVVVTVSSPASDAAIDRGVLEQAPRVVGVPTNSSFHASVDRFTSIDNLVQTVATILTEPIDIPAKRPE